MAISDLEPGDPAALGPYRLTRRLGAGGMGVVYLGRGPDGETVALKTLRADAGRSARARLAREAGHLRALRSPRVARLVACDPGATIPWIALSYVPGPSLAEARLPLPEHALRTLGQGLDEALLALRTAGIVHRDIKPGNVVLGEHGPVLIDLGIAENDAAAGETQMESALGSPGWVSPEQLRGEDVTPATDVWGWGGVMAYASTGRSPFGDGDLASIAYRIAGAEPDLTGAPVWLRPIVLAALSKSPSGRPEAGQLTRLMSAPAPAPTAVSPADAHTTSVLPLLVRPAAVDSDGPPVAAGPSPSLHPAYVAVAAALVASILTVAVMSLSSSPKSVAADLTPRSPSTSPAPEPSVVQPSAPAQLSGTGRLGRARGKDRRDGRVRISELADDLSRRLSDSVGSRVKVDCRGKDARAGDAVECEATSEEAGLDDVPVTVVLLDGGGRRYRYAAADVDPSA